ncbi:chemical-damaging agent resistance protein C [Photobacterium halotolerans]|uniref:Chemical-damaging agent resistance protein C n=1 Tax=Photobacterium halotolerans TaxID=265726 RepID=A0A7X5AV89_9GAMM|nr:TerD family protein [Photobacterium halotolerans]NAW67201.1 chemical-damaging agent resistance protein C [Photobacterium halotolerans]NAX46754.1 chemical-damaging agent resistance protein C [Photobacterium halotolerans]
MAINLEKGNSINLQKTEPGLVNLRLGLGWDPVTNTSPFDIDASAFVCRHNAQGEPKLLSDGHFIFYNNLKCPQGAVVHTGDNRTGNGEGDDESIKINLTSMSPDADEISLIVTIHDAPARNHNFGLVKNSYIKLYNEDSGQLIAQFNLGNDFHSETSVQFGSLFKENGQWNFKAVGAGYQLGLVDFVNGYQ